MQGVAFGKLFPGEAFLKVVLHAVLFLPTTLVAVIVLPREGIGSVRELRRVIAAARLSRAASPILALKRNIAG